jgi:hypothetical protein
MLLKKKLLPIFSLKGSIIFGFLVLLLVTFVTMFGYRYIENNKANVTIGESFINFTHTKIISRLEKEFSNIQFLSGLGDQLYNTEKEVDLNNIVLIGGMREILRNTPLIKSVKTGTKSGKFLQVIRIDLFRNYKFS